MTLERRRRLLLRAAGFAVWLFVGYPALRTFGEHCTERGSDRMALWAGAFVVFGVCFWFASARIDRVEGRRATFVWLAVQSLAALVMFDVICTGLEVALLVVVAGQLGFMMSIGVGLALVAAQTAILGFLGATHWPGDAWGWWMAIASGFQGFGFFTAHLGAGEMNARAELARTNAELRATREILAGTTKMAERVRIARELHDLIGHHLTALSLNLEAAGHMINDDRARSPVEKAKAIAKQLLGDVREVVSDLREQNDLHVNKALAELVAGIPELEVHLAVPEDLEVPDADRAQALLRCVQEIITNTARHARAKNLWIEIAALEDGIALSARDDGTVNVDIQPGNGLNGMRERLIALGGRLDLDQSRGSLSLRAWLPGGSA